MISISLRSLMLAATTALVLSPICVEAEQPLLEDEATAELTQKALGDALSCHSSSAAANFLWAVSQEEDLPAWMQAIHDPSDLQDIEGIKGFQLHLPVSILGVPVEKVYFVHDLIITRLPREKVLDFVKLHKMQQVPSKYVEGYYRFLNPLSGPMLNVFVPGAEFDEISMQIIMGYVPRDRKTKNLFLGCDYAQRSLLDFINSTKRSDLIWDRILENGGGG